MASGLGGMAVDQPIIGYDSNDATIVTAETSPFTGGGRKLAVSAGASPLIHIGATKKAAGRKGTVLFDFSDTANWVSNYGAGTRTADATYTKRSAVGLKVDTVSTYEGVKKTFTSTFTIQQGAVLSLIFFLPESSVVLSPNHQFIIRFSNDGGTNGVKFQANNGNFKAGWNSLTVKAGEDGTTDPFGTAWTYDGTATALNTWGSNFNFCQIFDSTANGTVFYLDSLVVGAKNEPRVIMNFDGLGKNVLATCAPSLKSCGWPAGLFTDFGNFSGQTLVGIQSLIADYGWSVGTMGIGHTSYNSNGRDIGADFETCAAEMVAAGIARPTTWAYPQNQSSLTNDNILAAHGVKWRRGYGADTIHTACGFIANVNNGLIPQGTTQHVGQNFDTGTAYARLKTRIDQMCLTGGMISIFTHNESPLASDWSLGGDLSQWYAMLDYLWSMHIQYGLEVITPEQAYADLDASNYL